MKKIAGLAVLITLVVLGILHAIRFVKVNLGIREDLVIIILKPPDIRTQTGKLPDAIYLPVPHGRPAVRVALDRNRLARLVGVLLMRHADLVAAGDLRLGNLLPSGRADEMLRLQQRIPEELWIGSHCDELIGWHVFPYLVEERAVIDLDDVNNAPNERWAGYLPSESVLRSCGDGPSPGPHVSFWKVLLRQLTVTLVS